MAWASSKLSFFLRLQKNSLWRHNDSTSIGQGPIRFRHFFKGYSPRQRSAQACIPLIQRSRVPPLLDSDADQPFLRWWQCLRHRWRAALAGKMRPFSCAVYAKSGICNLPKASVHLLWPACQKEQPWTLAANSNKALARLAANKLLEKHGPPCRLPQCSGRKHRRATKTSRTPSTSKEDSVSFFSSAASTGSGWAVAAVAAVALKSRSEPELL